MGSSLPSWLITPEPVLLKNYYRTSKYQPIVNEVELIDANPNYAKIRYQDGSEANVSIKDLAPTGTQDVNINSSESFINLNFNSEVTENFSPDKQSIESNFKNSDVIPQSTLPETNVGTSSIPNNELQAKTNNNDILVEEPVLRRSDRVRKAPDRLQAGRGD